MNELEKKKTDGLPATEQTNPFEAYGNAATARTIEGTLLRFSKGNYVAGQEAEEIPLGTRLTAIMDSLCIGWVDWQDNTPIEQRMGLVVEGYQPERRKDLGDLDETNWERDTEGKPRDPWQFTNYLIMRRVSDDTVFTFTTSSKGGLGAIGELSKEYGKAIRQRPDQYPVIELDVGSYLHRDRSLGRIKFPIFKIVDWTSKDGSNTSPATPPKSPPPSSTAAKPAAGAASTSLSAPKTNKPAKSAQPRF